MTNSNSLQQLLQESEQLFQQEAGGQSIINKDYQQLTKISQQYRNQGANFLDNQQYVTAAKTLANQGIDANRLNKQLKDIEKQSLQQKQGKQEEQPYLLQDFDSLEDAVNTVQHRILQNSLLRSQKAAKESFNNYLLNQLDHEWIGKREEIYNNFSSQYSTHINDLTTLEKNGFQSITQSIVKNQTLPRLQEYAKITLDNQFDRAQNKYNDMTKNCRKIVEQGQDDVYLIQSWQLLESMINQIEIYKRSQGIKHFTSKDYQKAYKILLQGSREHLEKTQKIIMEKKIQQNRLQARRGGDPSDIALVEGYLRASQKQLLEGVSNEVNEYRILYNLLRCGSIKDAIKYAGLLDSKGTLRDLKLQVILEERNKNNQLSHNQSKILQTEIMMLLHQNRHNSPTTQYLVLVLVVLNKDHNSLDQILRSQSQLVSNLSLEDFLWLKINCISVDTYQDQSSMSYARYQDMPFNKLLLEDFQQQLQQYNESYYTNQGHSPLKYLFVQLASLQFHRAILYLVRLQGQASEAIHMAIPLSESGILTVCEPLPQANLTRKGEQISEIIYNYAQKLEHLVLSQLIGEQDMVLSTILCYYLIGANSKLTPSSDYEGNIKEKSNMLIKFLQDTKLYGMVLGSQNGKGLSQSLLAKLTGNQQEVKQILEQSLSLCEQDGNVESAIEISSALNYKQRTLVIINQEISSELKQLFKHAQDTQGFNQPLQQDQIATNYIQNIDNLIKKSPTSSDILGTSMEDTFTNNMSSMIVEEFNQLRDIREVMVRYIQQQYPIVIRQMEGLDILPNHESRVEEKLITVSKLAQQVVLLLPELTCIYAEVAYKQKQIDILRALSLLLLYKQNLPRKIYRRVTQYIQDLSR